MTTATFTKAYPLLAMQDHGYAAAWPSMQSGSIESSVYAPAVVASSLPLTSAFVTEIVAGLPSIGDWGISGSDVLNGLDRLLSADLQWASALQIADYLLTTVIGHAPDTDVLDQALSLLIDHPPGEFLWQLAESVADQIEVDLVGLLRAGLDIF